MFNANKPTLEELPTTAQLLWSTAIALIGAIVLLVTVVLPAEYGKDPTGIGNKLGLTSIHQAASGAAQSLEIHSVSTDIWRDVVNVTIDGYAQLELKLTMQKQASATFEWQTDGGSLDSDMHGDGVADTFVSYRIGEAETGDSGTLTAEFDGDHGWYWQNKSKRKVTVTLRTNGDYKEIKRVM